MKERLACKFLGLHKYTILKEEDLYDSHGNVVGRNIVSRCDVCGKLKITKYYLEKNYANN